MITPKLIGAKDIERALRDLPKATAKNVLKRALTEVSEPIAETMRSRAPVGTDYRETIGTSTKLSKRQARLLRRQGKSAVMVHTGARKPHSHLIEHGSKDRWQKTTGRYTGRMPAQPHLLPAWEQHKDSVLPALGGKIWSQIEKAVARIARKKARQAGK